MQNFKYFKPVFENGRKNFALIFSQSSFVRQNEIYSLKRCDFDGVIHLNILAEEGFGDFMSQSDAFLK